MELDSTPTLERARLAQCKFEQGYVSAASIQSTRAACLAGSTFAFGNSAGVHAIDIDGNILRDPSKFTHGKKASLVSAPVLITSSMSCEISGLRQQSEVQSITTDATSTLISSVCPSSWRLAAVDSRGHGTVATYDAASPSISLLDRLKQAPASSFNVACPRSGESGWAGIALHPLKPTVVAIAHSFSKQISVCDGSSTDTNGYAIVTADWQALHMPTGIAYCPAESPAAGVLVVTEMGQISVWDDRCGSRPCIARDQPGQTGQTLYCIAVDGNSVAVAGTDATVYVYDVRNWGSYAQSIIVPSAGGGSSAAAGSGRGGAPSGGQGGLIISAHRKFYPPAKYDITGLQIDESRQLCYIAGSDQEVLCGCWDPVAASGGGAAGAGGADGPAAGGANRQRKGKVGGGAGEGRSHGGGFTGKQPQQQHAAQGKHQHGPEAHDRHKRQRIDEVLAGAASAAETSGVPADSTAGAATLASSSTASAVVAEAVRTADQPRWSGFSGLTAHTGFRGEGRWIGISLLRTESKSLQPTPVPSAKSADDASTGSQAALGKPMPQETQLLAVSEAGYAYLVGKSHLMSMHSLT